MDINKIKQKLNSNPEFNAASKRLAELHQELQAAQREHTASEASLQGSWATTGYNDDKARAVIERRDIASVDSLREVELRDRERVTLLERAIEMQSQTVNQLHSEISGAICRDLRAEHAKLADAIAEAALQLREANRQETSFRHQLAAIGVETGTLPLMAFLDYETGDEPGCALNYYLGNRKAA